MRPRWLTVLTAVLLAACTTESPNPTASADRFVAGRAARSRVEQEQAPALMGYAATDSTARGDVGSTIPDNTNMVIRTANASIEVDSLEPAIAELKTLASRVGGYVAGSGIEGGKNRLRTAFIEVKIPAARFDEALSGLTPIGKLESVNVAAQDVGEEFVDVNARMDNARRLEQRLIGLLANRTGRLKDVLDVERELARVREEIDRYEGRIRYLKAHTAMSTLSVTIHEPVPVVGDAGKSVMGEAFRQAWRNFVVLVSVGVQSLGVVLPLGLIAALGWMVTRRWRGGPAKQQA